MFHAIPMQRISIHLVTEDVPHAALLLADTGCFAPYDMPIDSQKDLTETAGIEFHELYHAAHNRFEKIIAHDCNAVTSPVITGDHVPSIENLKTLNAWLTDIWAIFSEYEERMRTLDERTRLLNNLNTTLNKFTGLDLDLGSIRKDKSFLDIRVGVLPEQNLSRFSQAMTLANYVLHVFHRKKGQAYVVVAGLINENADKLRLVLNAASFNAIQIPPEFHDKPEVLSAELESQRAAIIEERAKLKALCSETIEKYKQQLSDAWCTLNLIEPHIKLGAAIHSKGGLSVINGWVPHREMDTLEKNLADSLPNACYIQKHTPVTNEFTEVPTAICYPQWLKPFAQLIRQYGTPRYGEFDPTWFFMISSVLMFGAMFGDIGQGGIIVLCGIALRSVLKEYTPVIILNGISSAFFGFCYGSIFGNEHFLTPLWQSPLGNPTLMLAIAVYYGLAFVSLMLIINIYNQLRSKRYLHALYAPNGIAGLALLAGLYMSGNAWLSGDSIDLFHLIVLIASSGSIMYHSWIHTEAPNHEKSIIIGIELFEAVIGLISNTLSFLRVAAFSLNHVALMIAIYTIASMLDTTGYWLTIVIGNIFIVGFEGAIVMIQVLRLEYYEGLSRYFLGDGRLFRPLVITNGKPIRCCYI